MQFQAIGTKSTDGKRIIDWKIAEINGNSFDYVLKHNEKDLGTYSTKEEAENTGMAVIDDPTNDEFYCPSY